MAVKSAGKCFFLSSILNFWLVLALTKLNIILGSARRGYNPELVGNYSVRNIQFFLELYLKFIFNILAGYS